MTLRLFPKSLRWRLQLWLALLLASVLTGFCVAVSRLHRMSEFRRIDERIEARLSQLGDKMRDGGGPGPKGARPWEDPEEREPRGRGRGPQPPPERGGPMGPEGRGPGFRKERPGVGVAEEFAAQFAASLAEGFYVAIWTPEGFPAFRSALAPPMLPLPAWSPAPGRFRIRTRGEYREAYYVNMPGNCLLVGKSLTPDLDQMDGFNRRLYGAGLLVFGLGLFGGWCLTTRAIRPIEAISAAARRISDGHLSDRIPVADEGSELGRLAGVLNTTFDRLEAAFARQRQFTADASHELRTPLTVMIAEAQTTLSRPRSAEEYRESVETCLEEAQRMRRLASSLLELAKLDDQEGSAAQVPVDLAALTADIVAQLESTLARDAGVTIRCDPGPALVAGHPDSLVQVVTNLVSNAMQYTPAGGEIQVTTRTGPEWVSLMVADSGCGIAAEDLPHLFERFYRADKSRARSEGHFGLGLAIVKAIVDAHRGTIEVQSVVGQGTTVSVWFPVRV